jgi:hypothetical protein
VRLCIATQLYNPCGKVQLILPALHLIMKVASVIT